MADHLMLWLIGILLLLASDPLLADHPTPPADLTRHPLYKNHVFDQTPQTVDLGIQPLWLPSGVVTEVIRRDALLQKELRHLGLEIRFHPFLKGADVNFFLHAGKLEGGIGGDMPTLTACVNDQVQVVSLADLNFTAIVTRHAMLVVDLRGHHIGYAHGSNAHFALLQALTDSGLQESDVTLHNMEVSAMAEQLRKGSIDAFAAWEPTPAMAVFQDGAQVSYRALSSGYLYFTDDFASRHPQAIRHIIAAQVRALAWLDQSEVHLQQAVGWVIQHVEQLVGKNHPLDQDELTRLAMRGLRNLGLTPLLPETDLARDGPLARAVSFLRQIGKLPAATDWSTVRTCFKPDQVREVLATPQPYRLDQFDYSSEIP